MIEKRDIWDNDNKNKNNTLNRTEQIINNKTEQKKKEVKETPFKKISFKSKRNILIIVIALIMLILLAKPILTGLASFSSESELELTRVSNELLTAQASLKENKEMNTLLLSENSNLQGQINNCTEKKTIVEVNYNALQQSSAKELEELKSDCDQEYDDLKETLTSEMNEQKVSYSLQITELNEKLEELNNTYDNFVMRTANSVCCKQKIDDSSINYYRIENNYLICSKDSGNSLSCSFG